MRKNIFGILVLSLLVLGLNGIGNASLSDGLVAYYPFNGNANDESGNGNNGTVYGATLTTDRFGNANSAYSFDGNNDYIDCGNGSTINISGSFSISSWCYYSSGYSILGKEGGNGSNNGYYLWINPVDKKVHFGFNKDQSEIISLSQIEINKWVHIVGTWDSSSKRISIYINSILDNVNILSGNPLPHSNPLYLGYTSAPWATEFSFIGKIDDIRIYNRAISASEIQEIYYGQTCYEQGFVAGVATCKANPASCGINVNGGDAVTLTSDLKMHLPNIEYNVPFIGIMSMWADLVYDPTKTDAAYFKVTGAGAN